MPKYKVKFYKGSYASRQAQANDDRCVCYVEHHFNAGSPAAGYTCVVVANNASATSKAWGKLYAKNVTGVFSTKLGGADGLLIGGYKGRGNANLVHTNMPAILVEPLFCSNPKQAAIIKSAIGQENLARALAYSIKNTFPKGGLVGFSVGHKYKPGKMANDRGAAVHGGGTEADYAEIVLIKAAKLLEDE